MAEGLVLKGTMRAHTDMVTAIATPIDNSDTIVSASRDKSIIVWKLTKDDKSYGVAQRRLTGHSHFVEDVVLSSDGQFALSGSWDGELRLWDLAAGVSTRRFVGHTKDVLSVAFSLDNRQIVSASRDRTIKLWNTLGECKYTIAEGGGEGHRDWVSCVRFSPNTLQPTIVSASWDKTVKVWNLSNCKLRSTLAGHTGYVNTVAVSPDGSLCASGGKDGVVSPSRTEKAMTNFSRSKSTGTTMFPDIKTTRPGPDIYENIHHDDYEYEDEHSTTSTDYYDVSTPLSSHGSRSGPGSGQYTILDVFAAVLKKSLVMSCAMERGDDDVAASMDIGWPTEVKHVSHVTFDRFSGFLGLPSELEPEVPPQAPSASVSVFGVSAKSMQCSYDNRGNSVPTILLRMQKRLYTEGGLKAEGIFRINPDNGKEEHVRKQLNRGVIPRGIDVHCLAGLIKAWFRELPTGVLDVLTPEQVMKCNTEEDCNKLVTLLPPVESALLDWAIGLMADVVEHEQFNKMNARNVAMVFAPNMTQMADPLTALIHAVQVMNFLKTLILMNLKEREKADTKARWIEKQTSDPSEEWESQHSEILAPEKPNKNPKFLRVATLCRLEADINEEKFLNIEKRNDHKDTTENTGTVQRLCKHPLFKSSRSTKKPLVSSQDEGRRGRDAWGSRLSSLPW